jgi:hypothetical protein
MIYDGPPVWVRGQRTMYQDQTWEDWKAVDQRNEHYRQQRSFVVEDKSWMDIYPTRPAYRLSDSAVRTTLRIMFDIQEKQAKCVNAKLTNCCPRTASLDHALVCSRCSGAWWTRRHDEGVYALLRAAREHDVPIFQDVVNLLGLTTVSTKKKKTQLEEAAAEADPVQRKRLTPDGYLMARNTDPSTAQLSKLSLFDFAVVHVKNDRTEEQAGGVKQHRIGLKKSRKRGKYKDILVACGILAKDAKQRDVDNVKINTHVQPLVITSTGLLDKEFVQWLYAAATTGSVRGFANHAIASIQVAVLNQQARSLDHLSERIARLESARSKVLVDGASTALEKDIVVDSDEEEDPTVHLNDDGDLAVSQHVPEVDGGGGGGLSVDSGDGVGARVYSGHKRWQQPLPDQLPEFRCPRNVHRRLATSFPHPSCWRRHPVRRAL